MQEIRSQWGHILSIELELSDIEVGKTYKGNRQIDPQYLNASKLTVLRKGRKNVFVSDPAYPNEEFNVAPYMLDEIKDDEANTSNLI